MTEFNKFAVGRTVRRLRRERMLSQEVLSGLAGLARSHLTMIECGEKKANFETIWRIANAFGIPPHVLVQQIEEEAARAQSLPADGENAAGKAPKA